jgi:hypothetical protein
MKTLRQSVRGTTAEASTPSKPPISRRRQRPEGGNVHDIDGAAFSA